MLHDYCFLQLHVYATSVYGNSNLTVYMYMRIVLTVLIDDLTIKLFLLANLGLEVHV